MTFDCYESPLGRIVLSERDGALTALRFGDATAPRETAATAQAKRWLDAYFSGGRPDPRALPLAPEKTAFRARVREALLQIPCGKTATYGEIAKRLATSPRAVGRAVGANPLLLIVPCHRVVGADGSLTGYAAGIARKAWLLAHEKA